LILRLVMEKQILFGILGIIVGYFLLKLILRHEKESKDIYTEILTDDKYKVKGQWDR